MTESLEVMLDWYAKVNETAERLHRGPVRLPTVVETCRMRTYAGYCYYAAGQIRINMNATPEHRHETVGHELAHWLAFTIQNHRGHGIMWKFWMRQMGLEPRRCHSYPELLSLARGHTFFCGRCGQLFKTYRDIRGRYHKRCGGTIVGDIHVAANQGERP